MDELHRHGRRDSGRGGTADGLGRQQHQRRPLHADLLRPHRLRPVRQPRVPVVAQPFVAGVAVDLAPVGEPVQQVAVHAAAQCQVAIQYGEVPRLAMRRADREDAHRALLNERLGGGRRRRDRLEVSAHEPDSGQKLWHPAYGVWHIAIFQMAPFRVDP